MIDLENQTALCIDLSRLEHIAHKLSQKTVELIITDAQTIQSINQEYRNKAESTDVLSFPIDQASIHENIHALPLGSIIICEVFVKKNAKLFNHSMQDELELLFIHGMLHLLGFDHENDHGEMRQEEEKIIQSLDLPKSLIIRTQEY